MRAGFSTLSRMNTAPSPRATEPARPTAPAGLRVTRALLIPTAELRWQYSSSGGPGGQHANTSNTRAEVTFDVEASPSLSDTQRERILAKLGSVVRVVASDTRSQARNRQYAEDRLRAQLTEALRVEKPRRPTKPSRSAKARRLDAKSRQGARKVDRQRPTAGGD